MHFLRYWALVILGTSDMPEQSQLRLWRPLQSFLGGPFTSKTLKKNSTNDSICRKY